MNKNLKETAVGGSTGAGAIAVNPSRMGSTRKRISFSNFLIGKKERKSWKPKLVSIKEYYDISDVVSKLKSIEGSDQKNEDIVTYGVEDDNGNIMKISIKKEQAKDFEERLAWEMQEAKDNKVFNTKMNTSLAELLFNLKDQFSIVDVDFPKIPKDAVYNADQVSYGPDSSQNDPDDVIDDDINLDNMDMNSDEMPMDGSEMGDDMLSSNTEMGEEDMDEMSDSDMENSDETTELESDDDSVEDYVEDEKNDNTPEGLLQTVIDMLKADAESKKAQAEAAAEEARARQAEYAYRTAQTTVAHEEEFAKMELEMEQQKQKEKEAKKLANYAKHRVRSVKGMQHKPFGLRESIESPLQQIINELDQFDTIQSLNKARALIKMKYQVRPEDDEDTRRDKQALMQSEMREINTRLRSVQLRNNQMKRMQTRQQMMQKNNQNNQNTNSNMQNNGSNINPNMGNKNIRM